MCRELGSSTVLHVMCRELGSSTVLHVMCREFGSSTVLHVMCRELGSSTVLHVMCRALGSSNVLHDMFKELGSSTWGTQKSSLGCVRNTGESGIGTNSPCCKGDSGPSPIGTPLSPIIHYILSLMLKHGKTFVMSFFLDFFTRTCLQIAAVNSVIASDFRHCTKRKIREFVRWLTALFPISYVQGVMEGLVLIAMDIPLSVLEGVKRR
ncbi:hypothetical protein J6590_029734 [Homalodisca vitripennis]|nr:hypothetical protein J6590_029734 [Homalodisca vitripennis]